METLTLTPLTLDSPLADALDPAAGDRLATLGLHTIQDLLTHWPRKWRERGEDIDLALIPDDAPATVHVTITRVAEVAMKNNPKRRFLNVTCATTHGRTLEVSLFSPWTARKDGIKAGAQVTFSGKVKSFKGKRQMSNPEYSFDDETSQAMAGSIVSVYPATAQAPAPWVAEQVQIILSRLSRLPDPLPVEILFDRTLPTYDFAVRQMHAPATMESAELAKRRLTYDEAFATQLALVLRRHGAKATPTRPLAGVGDGTLALFDQHLPFTLTLGQMAAGERISKAMNSTKPTNALVEGEVGSGKTIVAIRAMLQAVDSGAQCAFVAPTEVLAGQHFESLSKMLEGLDITIALLTGSMPTRERRTVEQAMADGTVDVVVGTQILTTGRMVFDNLGLVVVDEQHRFGVAARDALRAQAIPPHMIVMTATPIPRTLAMTVYGDLDIVELAGLPGGRQPISTVVIPLVKEHWVARLWDKIGEEIANGRQAFIVASLIDPADTATDADGETVNTDWADGSATTIPAMSIPELGALAATHLPAARIGFLHSRLDPARKHEVMAQFTAGDLDILVSTTVIEVGVDVPNATVMAIWDADRFGIAQLHQLRGRVGRGTHAGLCLLVTGAADEHISRHRLDTVAGTLDGHKLALADLKSRREGDILGTGQAGRSAFKLLDLTSAQRIIGHARKDAEVIVKSDPALRSQAHRGLAMWLRETVGDEAAANLTRS